MSKKILSASLVLLSLFIALKSDASAKISLGKDIVVSKEEAVEGPYFNYGDNVLIGGTVNGDAYIAGGSVTIDGVVNGDLIVGGGVVTVKGRVSDDVRALGGLVIIDGEVGKNVTAFGGTVTLGAGADVKKDLIVGSGTFAHLGNINGKVKIFADTVTIAGRVGKNAEISAQEVSVTKTAILDGNLNYTSKKEAEISNEAALAGKVTRTTPAPTPQKAIGSLKLRLLSYLSLLLTGLVFLKVAPKQVASVAKLIGEKPRKAMGIGFLTLILTPPAIILLAITIVGLPLAAIAGGVYVLMLALSSLFTGLFVGQKIFDRMGLKENPYAMMAAGLLVLQLVFAVPLLGFVAQSLSLLLAMGAMLILKQGAIERIEKKGGEVR